jgi:hypothetical protein
MTAKLVTGVRQASQRLDVLSLLQVSPDAEPGERDAALTCPIYQARHREPVNFIGPRICWKRMNAPIVGELVQIDRKR